jgi:hypothetical protein
MSRKRKPKPPLERNVEKRANRYAKRKGMISRKMNGLGFRSWSDRLYLPPKGSRPSAPVLWVEFKRLGKDLTVAQAEHHQELEERGQERHVVRTLEEFKNVVYDYLKEVAL